MKHIFFNQSMDIDCESEWIKINRPYNQDAKCCKKTIKSIQIIWQEVQFVPITNPKGILLLYYTNYTESKKLFSQYDISIENNIDDSLMIDINSNYSYFKVKFISEDIISGLLDIAVCEC